jgi:hypothetical protein
MPQFARYIGIDYSGAETADSSCKGLRVFMTEGSGEPIQVQPPTSPRRYWTRRGLAEWLREELDRDTPTLIGIDHGFSFPLAYFEKYRLSSDWEDFLVDFHHHWPTDAPHTYVCFIREDPSGRGLKRTGDRSWLRLTERWTPTAKSVFGFGVQGEVATSTHAGLPWLLYRGSALHHLGDLARGEVVGTEGAQANGRHDCPTEKSSLRHQSWINRITRRDPKTALLLHFLLLLATTSAGLYQSWGRHNIGSTLR